MISNLVIEEFCYVIKQVNEFYSCFLGYKMLVFECLYFEKLGDIKYFLIQNCIIVDFYFDRMLIDFQ